ncbi:MAG TPA: trehalose-phosphatase [Burkholderiales bacterium]|nr:trehalose-phosphatase [Burkholderiales bacterium]
MAAAVPPFRADWAFFLDLDGTLLDIAETPEDVDPGPEEILLLRRLAAAAGGALALISGRSLARIDQLFSPLVLPAAGQHGAEWRDAQGKRHRHRFPVQSLRPAAGGIRSFAARHRGLVFEDKGASMALHYRLAPQLAAAAKKAVAEAALPLGDTVEVQGGKMVVELKPAGCDKGRAIESFMREPPFAGRVPVFLGDDVTDEYGFRVVNRLDGHSVKVGEGPSAARWRLEDPAAARAWLGAWIEQAGARHDA